MSHVYVIGAEGRPVKVGMANNVQLRHTAIQICSPEVMIIHFTVHTAKRTKEIERTAHELLSEHRIRGEWFDVTPREAIAAVLLAVDSPEAARAAIDAARGEDAPRPRPRIGPRPHPRPRLRAV